MIEFDHVGVLRREDWANEVLATSGGDISSLDDPPPSMRALRSWLGGTPVIVISYPASKLATYDADAKVVATISALFPDAPVVGVQDLHDQAIERAVFVHPWPKEMSEIFRRARCSFGRLAVVT